MITIFKGEQWAVTNTGIRPLEKIPELGADFEIDAAHLLATIPARKGVLYRWPSVLAGNANVDICDFFLIFVVALLLHREKYDHDIDFSMLEACYRDARRIAADANAR